MKERYIVIGGKPFRRYTGTLTYTGLKLVGFADDLTGVRKLVDDNYEECGGLLHVTDLETGRPV